MGVDYEAATEIKDAINTQTGAMESIEKELSVLVEVMLRMQRCLEQMVACLQKQAFREGS